MANEITMNYSAFLPIKQRCTKTLISTADLMLLTTSIRLPGLFMLYFFSIFCPGCAAGTQYLADRLFMWSVADN